MFSQLFIQGLAVFAVIFFLFSFHAKSRKNILLLQLLSVIIWAIHFYLLSAWTGAVLITINGFVTILFLFKNKNKKLGNPLILYLSLLILIIFTIITWGAFYSIFPLLAVGSVMVARWQNNIHLIRIISFPTSVFWIVYDLFVGAYGSIIAEVLIITSILISLFRNKS